MKTRGEKEPAPAEYRTLLKLYAGWLVLLLIALVVFSFFVDWLYPQTKSMDTGEAVTPDAQAIDQRAYHTAPVECRVEAVDKYGRGVLLACNDGNVLRVKYVGKWEKPKCK
jgi:hypothetical protein